MSGECDDCGEHTTGCRCRQTDNETEAHMWRKHFLEEQFMGSFKFIPEKDKEELTTYFLCIPSSRFRHPYLEWTDCVSILLQNKGKK